MADPHRGDAQSYADPLLYPDTADSPTLRSGELAYPTGGGGGGGLGNSPSFSMNHDHDASASQAGGGESSPALGSISSDAGVGPSAVTAASAWRGSVRARAMRARLGGINGSRDGSRSPVSSTAASFAGPSSSGRPTAAGASRRIGAGPRARFRDEEDAEESAGLLGAVEGSDAGDADADDSTHSRTASRSPKWSAVGRPGEGLGRRPLRSSLWRWIPGVGSGGGGGSPRDRSRTISLAEPDKSRARYPPNMIRNQKYSVVTFLPIVLYEQFKFFFNLYFLLVALSQFIPALRIGFLATYIVPLSFVLCVTIGKEAVDDYERYKRDVESNSAPYDVLVDAESPRARKHASRAARRYHNRKDVEAAHVRGGGRARSVAVATPSSKLRVGDLVVLRKNQRVPADMVLLQTSAGDGQASAGGGGALGGRRSSQSSHKASSEATQFVIASDEEGEEGDDVGKDVKSSTSAAEGTKRDGANPSSADGAGGTCFVRTDQLDGETDWKLRVAVELTQHMSRDDLVTLGDRGVVYAGAPIKDIHTFVGNLTVHPPPDASRAPSPTTFRASTGDLLGDERLLDDARPMPGPPTPIALATQAQVAPLTAENVLWANTVLAAGSAIGVVVYTGRDTRAVMNTSHPGTKVGLLELEINRLSKILCGVTLSLSVGLVALNGFRGPWYVYIFRFLILFSSIIPISLRVNLDMGKTVYARQIQGDAEIPDTIVRTSTLPEELGRIEYLLSDKTGTLTQNEMELRRLHLGTMSYGHDSMDEVAAQLAGALHGAATAAAAAAASANTVNPPVAAASGLASPPKGLTSPGIKNVGAGGLFAPAALLAAAAGGRGRRDMSSRVRDVVLALALCHNVTPVRSEADQGTGDVLPGEPGAVTYQASSPDEVAIVRWTESVGLALVERDRTSIGLRAAHDGSLLRFDILEIFPFTSESKRMGIVVRERATGELTFYQKGADVVMARIVSQNDWLDEECGNMAREGLRTLVVGRKRLSESAWTAFERAYRAARIRTTDRNEAMVRCVDEHLERDLELLGLTGVEDKLQEGVKTTLELLRNAGVRVWMLTGDKIETATCIATSSKLVARNQHVQQVAKLRTAEAARDALDLVRSQPDCCLVIDGESLQLCLDHFGADFVALATQLSAVVACRCSPTQKADVARLIRDHTRKRVCCIGDGGNDVSMIQAADVGVGIVGKEGRQASLAADFSVTQFSHLTKLLLWHGRNSYQRSAKLAQFVIHRGLIISIIQAVFSAIFYFAPIALYQGWLMVGYATIFTMAPVFSLVLDRDVNEDVALLYPELYRSLVKGRVLSAKTFTGWLLISVYQGGTIMLLSLVLFENEFLNILSISFTALVVNELVMVALEITTWHVYMVMSEVVTLLLYCISIIFLPEYFDLDFVLSPRFLWKVGLLIAASSFPLYVIKAVRERLNPPAYTKLAMG